MAPPRILIVEDETIVAMDIEDELSSLGYTVTAIAISGEEAIQQTAETMPDLVLMDIRLKGEMDGIEAAEQIRTRFNIPVVYLTAYADEDTLNRAKVTEPFGYIIKPFQERDLHTTIEMAFYKHRMERRLQEYAVALEKQNRELDTFAHTVANNLDSLAKRITNHADTLQNVRLPDEYQQSIDVITRSGHKMNQVIQELLLLAKVRQADVTLAPLNMARIVAQAQQRLNDLIEEYEARIILPNHWPEVLGYGPWVEEVWINFLSHGIQYGGRPPRLHVGATIQSGGQVRFWVRDNGPGFTRHHEEIALFAACGQSDQVHERKLRLSIAQHIIEKLGGQVSVESEGTAGQGTVFSFTLPSPIR